MEAPAPAELALGEPGYPPKLTLVTDSPSALWRWGSWKPAARAVAVVGARAARPQSIALAQAIGEAVARLGVDVVSGGAIGVDAGAHRGALGAGGVTVAVLGTGVDVVYPPQHKQLFAEIRQRGALLSQFPPGATPYRGSFPTRNKVIAGLCDLVVVVEAGADSGSLHTARAARAYGRTVVAVPGSAGADRLLVSGARPAVDAEEVIAALEGRPLEPPGLPGDPDARRLYEALDGTPRDVGDLAFRAGLAIGTCAAAAIDLELTGLAGRATGGRYVRLR